MTVKRIPLGYIEVPDHDAVTALVDQTAPAEQTEIVQQIAQKPLQPRSYSDDSN